jgi:hypothetical protein
VTTQLIIEHFDVLKDILCRLVPCAALAMIDELAIQLLAGSWFSEHMGKGNANAIDLHDSKWNSVEAHSIPYSSNGSS